MEPLAPIIDQMRDLAKEEVPAPRTCQVRLWDDGTVSAYLFHSVNDDETKLIRYERTTGEIVWEHHTGARWEKIPLSGYESIVKPAFDESTVRVLTTVEPPYQD